MDVIPKFMLWTTTSRGPISYYSTAEVFTWKNFGDSKVLILYGGPGEHHELAVSLKSDVQVVEGSNSEFKSKKVGDVVVVAWDVSPSRRIVQIGDLKIFLLGE